VVSSATGITSQVGDDTESSSSMPPALPLLSQI